MAQNKAKFNKFMTGAVTATMVATAIVPVVASAAEFTDIDGLDAKVKAEVNKAVELGFFKDGEKFNPATQINRGQAALTLARYIADSNDLKAYAEKEGLEASVTAFKDVPASFKDGEDYQAELFYASLIVKKAGAFTQENLNATGKMTRSQMAKVIVSTFGLTKDANYESKITDIDHLDAATKGFIETLAANEVTNVTTFNPAGNVTRSQMASFLVRSYDVVNPVAVAPEVVSVSAINAKQILVKFNSSVGTNATDVASYSVSTIIGANSNNVLGAAVQEDGKSVLLTLEDAYRVSTAVAVAIDGVFVKDSIKDTFPKFAATVTVNDGVAPTIVSATSKTNTDEAQSVSVVLSEPITNTAIFKVNGKTVSASAVTTIDFAAAGVAVETVATEYILSGIELETGKTHTVEIINAEDYAENKAEDILSKTFTVTKDTEAATGKVIAVQDNKIKVTFDKAVNEASLSNVAFFTYDAATATYQNEAVTGPVKADKAGKEWTFTLDNANTFYATNKSTENVLVKVQAGVVDTAGNMVKPFDATVKLTEDVTGPTLESIKFDKNSKGEVTKLYFAFDELLDATSVDATIADTQVIVKDTTNNETKSFNTLFGAVVAELATDGKTVVATVANPALTPVTKGNYTFEVQTGATNFLVKDSSVGTNVNKKVTKTVNFGAVTNQVTVTNVTNSSVAADDQTITVTFEKPVTAASAKNPANYIFAGKALPADTEIVVAADGLTATFDLPTDFIAETDSDATIVIQNIKPVDSSATFKKYADVINVIDNTRPVITSSILGTGAIKLSFSEAVTATTPKDDIAKVKINGLELDATASYAVDLDTDVNTGNNVVVITVNAEESLNHDGTGFSYQYIDVDGDGVFNPSKDIQLRKATGITAPTSWANDNGIAKLNLSVITSVEVVTADTTTDIKDAEGNTIKPKATIKVK